MSPIYKPFKENLAFFSGFPRERLEYMLDRFDYVEEQRYKKRATNKDGSVKFHFTTLLRNQQPYFSQKEKQLKATIYAALKSQVGESFDRPYYRPSSNL